MSDNDAKIWTLGQMFGIGLGFLGAGISTLFVLIIQTAGDRPSAGLGWLAGFFIAFGATMALLNWRRMVSLRAP